jgi:predicted metal-dependent phosphoesterase TrpH
MTIKDNLKTANIQALLNKETGMRKTGVKIDIHVHSKYSSEPAHWFLKKIGCGESYTEPIHLYQIARSRGMDFVTITDHDSILGSLEIAPLEKTFISQEITTKFPGNGCKVHVLAYGISESQHADIMKHRENVFDLVEYLNREQVFHGLAHPLFAVNDRLGLDHFEQCLLLFKNLELNGSRDKFQNGTLMGILECLDSERIDFLSNKHDLAPYGEIPWKKRLIGGSDDHCGMNIARTYKEFHMEPMAENLSANEFLSALERLERDVVLQSASAKTLAHTLYSIASVF